MKRIGAGILLFLVVCMSGRSQAVSPDTVLPAAASGSSAGSPFIPRRMHVTVQAGTQFWSVSGWGSGLNTFIMPQVTYPVGKRFSVGGGIGIINTTSIGKQNSANELFGNGNSTRGLIYVTGQYLLSRRLTISGTAFKEFDIYSTSPDHGKYSKTTPQGIFMKADYKINEFMHIEAGFGYTQGVNPYYNPFPCESPFGTSVYSPFGFH